MLLLTSSVAQIGMPCSCHQRQVVPFVPDALFGELSMSLFSMNRLYPVPKYVGSPLMNA